MAKLDLSRESSADLHLMVVAGRYTTDPTRESQALAELARRRSAEEDARDERQRHLAEKQMAHATRLADQQDKTAKRVAWATIWAAVAAGLSAIGVVASALLELAKYLAK